MPDLSLKDLQREYEKVLNGRQLEEMNDEEIQ